VSKKVITYRDAEILNRAHESDNMTESNYFDHFMGVETYLTFAQRSRTTGHTSSVPRQNQLFVSIFFILDTKTGSI
jgi:hypothetical protein